MPDFMPIAYVKTNCPFSFKFRLFMTEADLTKHVRFVAIDPSAPSYMQEKADLAAKVGHSHTFPIVEVASETFRSDSDELILYFADLYDVEPTTLPTLNFYRTGLYPTFLEMFHILASPLGWIARFGRKPKAFQ